MSTSGTNITALAKPGVGTTAGPQWATDLNTSIDAVDDHDHSTNKGIRITPAAVNINSDLEFNQNSASELKNIIFDSSVTAATTSYSLYQASGNLYWRNGSGSAVQVTIGTAVNSGAGSISGMTGTDAGASYADGSKTFNFFTDSGNGDYGKMAHADLLLFKYTNDNTGDTDYVTIAANSGVSGSSGTIYVPSENGTFLTTATSYAGAIAIATSSGNSNIDLTPHGTGEVNISKVDINGGTLAAFTIDGNWTAASQTCANLGTVTTGAFTAITNLGNVTTTGTIGLGGKLTAGSSEIEGTNFDINGGTLAAFTIDGNWTAASQTCANLGTVTTADINGGTIDGATITVGSGKTLDVSAGTLTTSTAQKQTISSTAFASGTKMLFNQTAAPTGWTKVTSSNDVALRLTSGTVGTGGSIAFETAFASQTVPVHTLITAEIPAHTHTDSYGSAFGSSGAGLVRHNDDLGSAQSGATGGGGSHGHGSLNLDVSYVDVIIATKD